MSIKPGTTNLPCASIVSVALADMLAPTATIRPSAIATSRIAFSLREGSMTRPPLTIRSHFTGVAANRPGIAANVAVAAKTNWRRVFMASRVYQNFRPEPARESVPYLSLRGYVHWGVRTHACRVGTRANTFVELQKSVRHKIPGKFQCKPFVRRIGLTGRMERALSSEVAPVTVGSGDPLDTFEGLLGEH